MKIIFLDFDGVLNSERYIRNYMGGSVIMLDPLCMTLMRDVVKASGAKIVLTTSWRNHWSKNENEINEIGKEINDIFGKYGLEVFDKTPHMGYNQREQEIETWLSEHPDVQNFVVFDDKTLESDIIEGHFVKTAGFFGGICEHDVREAFTILGVSY